MKETGTELSNTNMAFDEEMTNACHFSSFQGESGIRNQESFIRNKFQGDNDFLFYRINTPGHLLISDIIWIYQQMLSAVCYLFVIPNSWDLACDSIWNIS